MTPVAQPRARARAGAGDGSGRARGHERGAAPLVDWLLHAAECRSSWLLSLAQRRAGRTDDRLLATLRIALQTELSRF